MKADLHIHTNFSPDCSMSLQTIIKVAMERDIEALAITDHNTTLGARKMRDIAPLTIIVGEEIRTEHGEIIGLFLEEEIPPGLSPEETVSKIKEQGGLVCVPHPFDRTGRSTLGEKGMIALMPNIDLIEVYNSRIAFEADNVQAEEFAQRFNLLRSGGSDAHTRFEIGKTFVEMPPFATKEEFLRGLAQGKVVGKQSSPLVRLLSGWNRLRKKYLR